MTDPKRVSMYDAERKSLMIAKFVMGLATLILTLMTHWNLFHTNLYMWQEKSVGVTDVLGIILFGGCIAILFLEASISNAAKNETLWYILYIILLVAAILVSCGFNFSL